MSTRPQLCEDDIARLMETLYGLKVSSFLELNSYSDRNFYVEVVADWNNPYIQTLAHHGYVIKVLNPLESKKKELIDAQHGMIGHLLQHGIMTPRPVPNVHGQLMSLETIPVSGDNECKFGLCMVRLFEYIPGKLLLGQPYTSALLFNLGEIAGRMDSCLKTFYHPAFDNATNRDIWCLTEIPRLRQMLYAVTDAKNAALAAEVIQAFEDRVVAQYHLLQKGTIHGDLNEQNILVNELVDSNVSPSLPQHRVHAILDFGDSSHSYYVFEIAILILYMMLEGTIVDEEDAGGHVLAGYMSQLNLNDVERDVLKECICARLVQSLVMAAYTFSQNPDNLYVLHTVARGWPLLHRLWATPNHKLYQRWLQVIDSYNYKQSKYEQTSD